MKASGKKSGGTGVPVVLGESSLSDLLREVPHPHMDLLQFLVVAGISPNVGMLGRMDEGYEVLCRRVLNAFDERHYLLTDKQKIVEGQIAMKAREIYSPKEVNVRAQYGILTCDLDYLKSQVEAESKDRILPIFGAGSLVYLNTVLAHFKIPIMELPDTVPFRKAYEDIKQYKPHNFRNRILQIFGGNMPQ